MSARKRAAIAVLAGAFILAVALVVVASQNGMLLLGDYYVKVDNAHLSQNENTGGVIHLKSGEPYIYELDAVNKAGDEARIEFGASRELRQDALLKLELQPLRGVVSWSEVSPADLPPKAAEVLG